MGIPTILKKLTKGVGLMSLIALPFVTNHVISENFNPYNMKTMPQIQPWVWLYDKNGDGEADATMVGWRGGPAGLITAVSNREPTQEEIDWYRGN